MSDCLISVIMPVYNGAKYVRKSVGSIFAQTYRQVELITMNDGSKDQSLEVLHELQAQAPSHVTMHVIDQENAGICETRNRALDLAKGAYVSFIDQDDFMNPDCLERLKQCVDEEQADVAIGGFDLVDGQGKVLEDWSLRPEEEWSKYRISAPWGRLFDKRVMDANGVRFMHTKISEDLYFNFLFFSYAKKIAVTTYKGYQWLYNEASESHANMSQMAEDRNPLVMMTQLMEQMKWPNTLDKQYFEYFMIKHVVWYLFYVAKSADKQQRKAMYEQCFAWLEHYFPEYQNNPYVRLSSPKGELLKIRIIVDLAMKLKKIGCLQAALGLYHLL